jgi:hypothetical protein
LYLFIFMRFNSVLRVVEIGKIIMFEKEW